MTYLLIGLYCLIAGIYIGEWQSERRNRYAVTAHDGLREAARSAMRTKRLVGPDVDVTNVGQWTVGKDLFEVTIRPL